MENNLSKEYEYFIKHQDELIKKYKNQFIVIKEEEVIGVYKKRDNAISETIKKHKLGTFLVQECLRKVEEQTFYSRVNFN